MNTINKKTKYIKILICLVLVINCNQDPDNNSESKKDDITFEDLLKKAEKLKSDEKSLSKENFIKEYKKFTSISIKKIYKTEYELLKNHEEDFKKLIKDKTEMNELLHKIDEYKKSYQKSNEQTLVELKEILFPFKSNHIITNSKGIDELIKNILDKYNNLLNKEKEDLVLLLKENGYTDQDIERFKDDFILGTGRSQKSQ